MKCLTTLLRVTWTESSCGLLEAFRVACVAVVVLAVTAAAAIGLAWHDVSAVLWDCLLCASVSNLLQIYIGRSVSGILDAPERCHSCPHSCD
ncbi:hypothetical protein TGRH88_032580 [Toxoplasma gondii]|uniref:Transmembrane protein n=1 Tax=Toxoplasma gondii TaxID=5811 RepID=A0A7J6K4X6_TOXGO|nr:hypothetical protein TGRH88_032580 [Toxoplasma gondii]